MKAPPFKYVRAETLDDALGFLTRYGDEARVIAGGQSLLPMMNMRVASPGVLVDINGLDALRGISLAGGVLRIGALARHSEVLASPHVAKGAPLLALAMPHVAHVAIRNRGTFGGSLALADPSAEIPAVCLALGARLHVQSPRGPRVIPASEFFIDLYTTALVPDEILVAAEIDAAGAGERAAFDELARRHGDYAIVGTCVQAAAPDGVVSTIRIAQLGVGTTPKFAAHAAKALEGRRLDGTSIKTACTALMDDIDPSDDLVTSAATKRYLAGAQLERVLTRLAARHE
jgi:aerobic carbon-monoxide dehydrogenase medium subunit